MFETMDQMIDVGTVKIGKNVVMVDFNSFVAVERAVAKKYTAVVAAFNVVMERFIDSYQNLLSILLRHVQPQQEAMCCEISVCLGSQKFEKTVAKLLVLTLMG